MDAHNVERYGRAEVERWYFEVWNEPNGESYWKGTPDEFHACTMYAIDAVRRALPTARVGGPDVAGAGGAFMDQFLAHVARGTNYATGKVGTPTDFLAFHAKGQPELRRRPCPHGDRDPIAGVEQGFAKIAGRARALASKPIVIGESDPEGCAACPGPQNAYRNGTMYSSYTAASFARIWELARRRTGSISKARCPGPSPSRISPGSPAIASSPPTASICRCSTSSACSRSWARRGSRHEQRRACRLRYDHWRRRARAPDVGTIATTTRDGKVAMLVWNYHDDDVAGPDRRDHA
jgi:xylan 1,4-beta-xylosidase